jgi:pimeloyl-ACP methyl ester carboxylesterase
MGAIVAFEIMRQSPERVLGLALLDTSPAAPDAGQILAWTEEIDLIERGRFESLIEERWIPMLLSASGSRGPSIEPVIRGMAMGVGPESYGRQLRAQTGRRDSWSLLSQILCPTLVLGGRQDTLCPPALQESMTAALPNARLALVDDCGHLSTLERPQEVSSSLRTWIRDARGSGQTAGATARGHHA